MNHSVCMAIFHLRSIEAVAERQQGSRNWITHRLDLIVDQTFSLSIMDTGYWWLCYYETVLSSLELQGYVRYILPWQNNISKFQGNISKMSTHFHRLSSCFNRSKHSVDFEEYFASGYTENSRLYSTTPSNRFQVFVIFKNMLQHCMFEKYLPITKLGQSCKVAQIERIRQIHTKVTIRYTRIGDARCDAGTHHTLLLKRLQCFY